ncbi:hypothetical protein ACJJTC_014358 [Scirpophaga incertulas]
MPPKNTKAIEERRRAQRLCKKRKYLEIKNDPELLAIEQEKRRNKYKKGKEEGKVKQIKELTPRGQREQRKKWKENSKNRQQVSLHTSVAYTHNFTFGVVTPISFCTVSDCLRHDAPATWAHLVPLILHVLQVNPLIEILHILSDSPSSQYRNKYMFFIITQICKDFHQIKKITWNYSEAGHGKGAPDGIGAVIKRTADRMILFGKDIGTYDQFCDTLMQTIDNVTIKMVDEQEILFKERLIPSNLKPFKGTFSVYQVLWDITVPKTVLRQLSCFDCKVDENCIHGYDLGYLPNNSYGHIENIDPNYVAPLSKSVNRNRNTVEQNPNKQIVVLSDITIGQNIL